MTLRIYLLIFFVMSVMSCRFHKEHNFQIDSISNVASLKDTTVESNIVHSEAPDAVTQMTQGYALPKFDDGFAQSPINILSDHTIKDSSQFASIHFHSEIKAVENLGHTIQLDFSDGSTVSVGGKIYYSKQFHFHTPSEHMIDGMTFPMEMHIVNLLKDSVASNKQEFLVIALIFKMGLKNKFIDEFLNEIPGHEEKDSLPSGSILLEDLINSIPENESSGYYAYKGSLTTPPYSESVTWVIKKYIMQASPEQINKIEKLEGDNARHVRALYSRKVYNH